ncbi:HYC_CC_PP family protein [Aquimarina spongiae]|uniref:Secreted protein n=1 Tax=Aquimarina spongiae TaxID=570521 RepID=A0A1M6GFK6_9FLAO|nr:hypothetical protein [Aquimarina spongiae]SHJ08663.1 hypothetical protein SAMN04488508_105252 [Aquimarina spongiae]
MKSFIQKISAVTLALVVLCSTMSFTVNMHYCGKTLVDVSLYKEAKTCEMDMMATSKHETSLMKKMGCCTDKKLQVEGQDELKTSFDTFTLDQQLFIIAYLESYLDLFEGLEEHIIPFKEYPPPFLVKDLQLLNETFLI